ncbi:MAG TPA: hypothetical protein VGO92_10210 [Acidimicrobiales bacterium]|jgi:hypothetical protein|nr:hypothetical protein [Acidimicrobiales bacterium]
MKAVLAVAARPRLWAAALTLVPPRWWRRPPFLPVPDRRYLAFRMETQYGRSDAKADPADVVVYLEWCRTMRRLAR